MYVWFSILGEREIAMSSNTGLTRELAVQLIRMQEVVCPKCGNGMLVSRYTYKKISIEYKCPACGEIYHPCKMI